MTKEKETPEKAKVKRFSKELLVERVQGTVNQVVAKMALEDGKTYTEAEAEKAVEAYLATKAKPEQKFQPRKAAK